MSIFRFFTPGLKQNWKVVVLSVTGAATFWFFNAMSKNYNTRIEYPLEYVFERDSVVVINPLAQMIKIDISSGGWNLIRKTLRISADPIQIILENPTEIKYLTRSSLTPIVRAQMDGLKLTSVVTDTLFFNIEKKATVKLPILVDSLTIPLKDNYRIVSSIKTNHDSVTFTGPKSYISKLVRDVEIDFKEEEIDGDFDENLSYRIDRLISASPRKTNVKFKVNKFILLEADIPIEFVNFPADSSISATQTKIKLYYTINEDHEDDVKASDFSVMLDYSMLNKRDSTIVPMLMYAHEKAIDVVLNVDKIGLDFSPKAQ